MQRRWKMSEEQMIHRLEGESREKTERVRAMLLEGGHTDALAKFDRNMRDIALGITSARNCWHSLSSAQRRVLQLVCESPRRLVRSPGTMHFYDALGEPYAISRASGLKTVRTLADRELLEWNGGAFDPERIAVLTERGRFVFRIATSPPDPTP
jgi:hypothetical protein